MTSSVWRGTDTTSKDSTCSFERRWWCESESEEEREKLIERQTSASAISIRLGIPSWFSQRRFQQAVAILFNVLAFFESSMILHVDSEPTMEAQECVYVTSSPFQFISLSNSSQRVHVPSTHRDAVSLQTRATFCMMSESKSRPQISPPPSASFQASCSLTRLRNLVQAFPRGQARRVVYALLPALRGFLVFC